MKWVKKVNNIQTINTCDFVKTTNCNIKIDDIEKKPPDHD